MAHSASEYCLVCQWLRHCNLASLQLPPILRRLYIARDNDSAGETATDALTARVRSLGVEVIVLSLRLADFNDDLRNLGASELQAVLRVQVAPEDVARFLKPTK